MSINYQTLYIIIKAIVNAVKDYRKLQLRFITNNLG